MKKNLVQGLSVAFLWVGSLLILNSCGSGGDSSEKPPLETKDTVVKVEAPRVPPPQIARVPEFSLTNQDGVTMGSAELQFKPYIVTFFFTRCQLSTPAQTAEMKKLQKALAGFHTWNDVQLLSITVDPEFDTEEVLKSFSESNQASLTNWSFLRGDKQVIHDLSKKGFGLEVSGEPNGKDAPVHSSHLVLVDRLGFTRGNYDATQSSDMDNLLQDLRLVMAEDSRRSAQPLEIINPAWEAERQAAQLATKGQFEVFIGFGFENKLAESGITWRHQIVDDAGKTYKPNHYDHGNGLLIADVDGDNLPDIYFITQIGENQLWKNNGNGTFKNITEGSGIKVRDRVSVSGAFADIDNDGDEDLYVTTVMDGNLMFLNDGKGRFKDITGTSGTGYKGHSSGVSFFDYNNDGRLDLFVSNVGVYTDGEIRDQTVRHPTNPVQDGNYKFHNAFKDAFSGHLKKERADRSILYRNEGAGKFKDVTEETKLIDESWNGDSNPLDRNGDGWIDLYLTSMQGDDQYWENVGGKYFVNKARELFPKTPWGAMSSGVFDYDNDGDMDIIICDMHSDMSEDCAIMDEKLKKPTAYPASLLEGSNPIFGNAFFQNKGDGTFDEISDQIGAENYWPWGLSIGDLNADGFEDVFVVSSMNFPFRYGPNTLLLNNKGKKFLDSEYILGAEPRKDWQTATWWFNLDVPVPGEDGKVVEGGPTQSVEIWGAAGGRSSAIFDMDNDGDLDIVTSEFNSEPMVLVSDLSENKGDLNWIKIKLEGTQSNRNGLGAVIKVKAGGNTYTKLYNGKSGYLSQSVFPVYFGLGTASKVDQIEIKWPSGKVQVVDKGIELKKLMVVKEL